MPVATHVIRGNVARLMQDQWRFYILGNSIHLPTNNYNVTQALFKNSPIPILGNVTGMVNSTGMPVNGSYVATGTQVITAPRPGEVTSGSNFGSNVRQTSVGTGDAGSFAPIPRLNVNFGAGPTGDWLGSRNIRSTFLIETDPSATNYTTWEHKGATRVSAATTPHSVTIASPGIQTAPVQIITKTSSTYSAGTGANDLLAYLQSGNLAETGSLVVLSGAIEVPGEKGVFGAYAGHGSWGLEGHASFATGQSIGAVVGPPAQPAYTARYTDAALIAEFAAYRPNCIILCPGPNETDFPGLEARIVRVMNRVITCAAAAGIPRPCFLLPTAYDAFSDNTTNWDIARNACIKLARSRADTECVDFGGWQRDTYGPWSAWSASQLSDSIHPATANATLRTNWANLIYSQVNQINYGGGGSFPGFLGTPPAWLGR